MAKIEVKVPDIGDFKDVEVIEVLVKPGDRVDKEQSLITVESDKASIEIPSPEAGVVQEMTVKMGDKVSQGSLILRLDSQDSKKESSPEERKESPQEEKKESPRAAAPPASAKSEYDYDMLVLGAGPGGYSPAFRAADLGMKAVLVERYPTLAGVGLNGGLIPSKALRRTAA